ncbi:MAG: hypothetical protein DI539_25215 [Flavobacterium psychrophilum]|nr:MAG: hypothetical protein DI539_25215 [Flavobacterium psychrophilum]
MAYSDILSPYEGELPEEVKNAFEEIKKYFSLDVLRVLKYDEYNIVVPIDFAVSIPPRGSVGGIDIRKIEPMLIKISLITFPHRIPLLLSDREDFPKERLSHLYVTNSDHPANLCLVRNSPDEWFASKRISDLLLVGEQWLFKAATGQLSEDGDEFDPLRLDQNPNNYLGHHSYLYDILFETVNEDFRLIPQEPMAVMLSYFGKGNMRSGPSLLKTISIVPFIQIQSIIETDKAIKQDPRNLNIPAPFFSMLVWSEVDRIDSTYITKLPSTFGELVLYFADHGIDIKRSLSVYFNCGLHLGIFIPITHAIKRPKKIVGYSGDYEFISFVLNSENFTSNKFPDEAEVAFLTHVEPFSSKLAQKLSGEIRATGGLFIGAGSLGSKLIQHDSKAGSMKIGVVDGDRFLNHNLARHVLGANWIGGNKAEAIINEISSWYEFDLKKDYAAFPIGIEFLPKEVFSKYDWIVDSTASLLVQNWISKATLPKGLRIARCEIADDGRLGMLYIEGNQRNPRLDDLINFTYYLGQENMNIREWRRRDAKREITNIDIGLGCSSTTTVMSDDTISMHAAIFSKVLYKEREVQRDLKEGIVYLNILDTEGIPKVKTVIYRVNPFESFICNADSGWEIRLHAGVKEEFFRLSEQRGKVETGGVLLGVANYKTKTIHVFEITKETGDSKGTYTAFLRGVTGLPAKVDKIKQHTGGIIGYVGEWHTHPMDLEQLSARDKATIEDLKAINKKIPIPTLAIIVTTTKILPFVFE